MLLARSKKISGPSSSSFNPSTGCCSGNARLLSRMHYDASILLVNDYEFIRTILERTLQQLGYQNLRMAADGVDALHLLRTRPVDLVITDYHMPEMDGIGLFQSMQQDPVLAKIPVLLISGVPTEKFVTQALAIGIQSTLNKPFRAEQLDLEIQSLLTQSLS